MVRSVQVFRREDGLPLVATSDAGSAQLDRDFPSHRETFKSILSNFPRITEEMSTVEAPSNYCFHILVPADALCDRSFNRQHAFGLLRAIKEAFGAEYDPGIVGASVRPYAFMRFEPRMQEIRRAFNEGRQRGNLDRLRDELIDVTKIMTTSINEVLERGDRLDKTSLISRELSDESKRYLEETRELNLAYMWRTYGPLCFMTFCVFILWVFYHYVL